MFAATLIIGLSALLLGAAIFVPVLAGSMRMAAAERRRRQLHEGGECAGNEFSERGISVIVCGRQNRGEIQRRLAMHYTMYELIVVWDFADDEEAAELLRHYGMVRMEVRNQEHLACSPVIKAFRSRQKRYRRIIFVDSTAGEQYEQINCGVLASSYDYILPLDADTFLTPDALRLFDSLLDGSPSEAVCGMVDREDDGSQVDAIDSRVECSLRACGLKSRNGHVTVSDRERIVAQWCPTVGGEGFRSGVRQCRAVVARKRGANRRHIRFVPREAVILFTGAATVATLAAALLGLYDLLTAVAVSVTVVYASAVAAAMTAVTFMPDHTEADGKSPHRKHPFAPLLYPFYRFGHTLSDKNFVNN